MGKTKKDKQTLTFKKNYAQALGITSSNQTSTNYHTGRNKETHCLLIITNVSISGYVNYLVTNIN